MPCHRVLRLLRLIRRQEPAEGTAGLVSVVTLRRVAHGPKLCATLLALAVVLFLQTAVGRSSRAGANLMWVHVPLGVALVGFAARAAAGARRLGAE